MSARERDLRPLLEEGVDALELCQEKTGAFAAFLEEAWLSGTRNGHAKLLGEALRHQEQRPSEPRTPLVEPTQVEDIEAEFKAMMEASAEVLNLPLGRTMTLWNFLSRAWSAGVNTYESEVMASLIERNSDIAGEAQRWLEEGEGDP